MYKLQVTERFAAAHHLRQYKGKCENLHGHNWVVTAVIGTKTVPDDGMVMDFHDLRACLREVLEEFDHSYINEHPYFAKNNPTSENMCRYIFDKLEEIIHPVQPAVRVICISVEESPGSVAIYER